MRDPQEDQLSLTVSSNSGMAEQQGWSRGVWDSGMSPHDMRHPTDEGTEVASAMMGLQSFGALVLGVRAACWADPGLAQPLLSTSHSESTSNSPVHILPFADNLYMTAKHTGTSSLQFFSWKKESKQSLWIFWLSQVFQSCEEIENFPFSVCPLPLQ